MVVPTMANLSREADGTTGARATRSAMPEMGRDFVARLQSAGPLEAKLAIAGFTLQPVMQDLPELMLPVESQWPCRSWRI